MASLKLYLLRHAKSSWKVPGLEDFDRPLTRGGQKAMETVGALAAKKRYVPDLILCSTARRTSETLAGLLSHLPGERAVTMTRAIYEASAEEILELIRRTPASVESLMVIGHNPGLETLARGLCADGKRDDLRRLGEEFPTAALAVIGFRLDGWSTVGLGTGRLKALHRPDESD